MLSTPNVYAAIASLSGEIAKEVEVIARGGA
jgi:hypothetical protein